MSALLDDTVSTGFAVTNGIRMHYLSRGDGPLVLLCHGFPEFWYSWRHQLTPLAEAGFRAVAVDLPGYGRSDKPDVVYDVEWVDSCLDAARAARRHERAHGDLPERARSLGLSRRRGRL